MTGSSANPNSPAHRALIIALNRSVRGRLESVYTLAAATNDWIDLAGRPLHRDALVERAAKVRVPVSTLRRALAILPRVEQIAASELAACHALGARIITRAESAYPRALLDLEHPPPVLYVRGEIADLAAVSIVGSRRTDPYGREVAGLFASELASVGLTVVSGLALGVDTAAHRGALEVGGRTIAVLGCGLDVPYPRPNRELFEEIASSGAVLSEFPLGSAPEAWRFPVRNRIIAALALGTLVVRATPRSGSLITARQALDLSREVWAVPGEIFDERSVGPNSLIRDGAAPVQHPREILESLPSNLVPAGSPVPERGPMQPPRDERLLAVLDALPSGRAVSEESVVQASPLATRETLAALTELELGGWIERHPGARFTRPGALPEAT